MTATHIVDDDRPAPAVPPPTRTGVRRILASVAGPRAFASARNIYHLASREELRMPFPLRFKLRAWRSGFKVEQAVLYDLGRVDPADYVTDFSRLYRCEHINPVPQLFDQKLLLRQALARHGFVQPDTVALIGRVGVVYDPLGAEVGHTSRHDLHDRLVAEGGRYIIKPQDGTYGRGISLLEVDGGRLVSRRGTEMRPFSIERDAPPNSLVERVVRQHEFWNRLSPYSVNTLRILTLWTPGDAEPFVAKVVQRLGTRETLPTDNWDGGGLLANVDLETGRLGPGRVNPFKSKREDRPYAAHPDTGEQIEGVALPFWNGIIGTTLAAARSLPLAYYIGWDVAVDEQGRAVFIEGNKNTGVRSLQIGRGLLADPKVRRFYEACGAL